MTTSSNLIRCGLDIGGTQIKAVLIDQSGYILEEFDTPSNAHLGPDHVKASVLNVIETIKKRGQAIGFVGIGCAGSVDSDLGIVRNSPNFSAWKNINLKTWAEQTLRIPTCVDNDANCATIAEWKLGKGRGISNLVLLTLGTGIGGGLVLQNRLYRGATGTGGELGHFSINTRGIECPCGSLGCFERYCSASALKNKISDLSSREIFERATTDFNCKKLVDEFLHNLQIGLVGIANVFDPDLILLGGGVSKGLHPHIESIRLSVKNRVFPAVAENLKIDFTQFGNNSGAIGAALLGDLKHY
ncbi:MAG: ROK family protein [Proteobacteria bacterium]|nr:ROK family protein [Pseudomonadota bacterium]NBY19043.1 ROK family protein [bacterium]